MSAELYETVWTGASWRDVPPPESVNTNTDPIETPLFWERARKVGQMEPEVLALFEDQRLTIADVQKLVGCTWNSARGTIGRLVRKGHLELVRPRAYGQPSIYRLST